MFQETALFTTNHTETVLGALGNVAEVMGYKTPLGSLADVSNLKWAAGDALYLSRQVSNQRVTFHSITVKTASLINHVAETLRTASVFIKEVPAFPRISYLGNAAGIYKHVNEALDEEVKLFRLVWRVSIIAINCLCLSPLLLGVTFSSQAFLITTSLIYAADIAQFIADGRS